MESLAASEPALSFEATRGVLEIQHCNVKECVINLYLMDLELLFSTQPFLKVTHPRPAFYYLGRSNVHGRALTDEKHPRLQGLSG